jgi:accessory gene regulator protein AgrB
MLEIPCYIISLVTVFPAVPFLFFCKHFKNYTGLLSSSFSSSSIGATTLGEFCPV